MEYAGDRVKDLNIAYIGGGSRGWAWKLMSDFAIDEQLSGNVKLYDIDYEAAYANEVIADKLSKRDDIKGKWAYKAVKSLGEALTGADFVIISILPGTFEEMASDIHAPEKYGIYQAVGDTVGPGGLLRALRAIPMYVEIAEAIKQYCPKAWVINYTNPMTLCTATLYQVFPEINAFGCCHEVFGTQDLLAAALKDLEGIEGVSRDEVKVNVLGINHFTWLDKASYKGMDLIPLYERFVDKYYEEGYIEEGKDNWLTSFFRSAQRVKFDLFRRYGLIAAAGDRHLVEFMPPWYLKDPDTVKAWKFNLTPASWRMKNREKLLEKSKRLVRGEEEVELKPSGEEGVRLMKALLGLGEMISNVNIPNQGQLKGIPLGAIVETNAVFTRDAIRPLMAGQLPSDVQNLVMRHVLNQQTILKAGLTKDKSLAFRAFVNDPLVTIDRNDAQTLFDEMLQNTKTYLPGWDV
ncbi:MAG: alpha-glucosidase/alpha-galactosidase [Firmicutes bacterium]|nr:alpha-glucosidase/alpha-galactosidase [Bacillota bacterium]